MQVAWGHRVSREFVAKVVRICRDFGWTQDHVSWLMACMAFESGETFSPSIRNAAGSNAVGLVQFMPSTAKHLGTSSYELSRMSAVEQLNWVARYFWPYKNRVRSLEDMYMAILMPKYIGYPLATPIFSGGIAYRQNSGLDSNRDGKVTKYEAAAKVRSKLMKGLRPENVSYYDERS